MMEKPGGRWAPSVGRGATTGRTRERRGGRRGRPMGLNRHRDTGGWQSVAGGGGPGMNTSMSIAAQSWKGGKARELGSPRDVVFGRGVEIFVVCGRDVVFNKTKQYISIRGTVFSSHSFCGRSFFPSLLWVICDLVNPRSQPQSLIKPFDAQQTGWP